MTIEVFKTKALEAGYEELPLTYSADDVALENFIVYENASFELKQYLCKHILCKCFYGTYMAWYNDVTWFINSFFKDYSSDYLKPELASVIKEAVSLILSNEPKKVLGTCFLFGIIEFYAKYSLGFRPREYDFFDSRKKSYVKEYAPKKVDLTISSAINFLKQKDLPVSVALDEIDSFTIKTLNEKGIKQERWIKYTISDRLTIARNAMLHGEQHSFSDTGYYLIMLYILFYLHHDT